MKKPKQLDTATVRWLAVEAGVDPKTIIKVSKGRPVRGMPGHRARAALQALGLLASDEHGDAPTDKDGER